MHDRRDGGHEECMSGRVQDMRNSEGRGPTSQHLKVPLLCGSAIFKGEGLQEVHFIHKSYKKVKISGKQP